MPRRFPDYQRFFAELKRRRVFHVMAWYGALAFAGIEAVDLVFPRLSLPDWTITLVVWVALLGFPAAAALAWVYDLTAEGLHRTEEAAPGELSYIIAAPPSKRWPSGVLALMGVIALLAGAWYGGRISLGGGMGEPGPLPASESIAVLPFLDLSQSGDQEYFSDGIAEELLNLLARIPELRVAARTSSFSFKGQSVGIPEIARRLNVAHVLEGSVRKAGNQVRVTAQLIRADDGFQVWSDTWDRTLEDIFVIQDEIAAEVVGQMRVTLLEDPPPVQQTDAGAYALYLQARQLGRMGTADGWRESNGLLHEALEIDPAYAPAWTELARNYTNQAGTGQRPLEAGFGLAREAAERALEIDPRFAPAHAALAQVAMNFDGDLTAAAADLERALELDPTNPDILGTAASFAQNLGRIESAIPLKEYVLARDPVNVRDHYNLGISYLLAGRYGEAIAPFQAALRLSPGLIGAHFFIGLAHLFSGDAASALEEFSEESDDEYRVKGSALALFALGRLREHEAALQELRERWGGQWPSEVAQVYAWTGKPDQAFEWLERAVSQNEDGITQQFLWPYYASLHGDSRWSAFRERTGTSERQLATIQFEVKVPR
jgi:TolB-like protein/thioredoxin-like negative regulator of GroEL